MRRPMSRSLLLSVGLALLCGVTLRAGAEDWPHWRGPRRDNISAETGLLRTFPAEGPKVLWERPMPGGWSQPSTSRGKLFIQTEDQKEEYVLCLEPTTGKPLWQFKYACDYDAFANLDMRFKSGPRATPTVEGDRVYALGTTGLLHCLSAADGKLIWKQDLKELGDGKVPDMGFTNSPFIQGDRLFVHPGGQNGNSLAALSKKDGSLLWKSENDIIGYATPIQVEHQGKPQLIYFTGTGVVAVAPDTGKALWRYEWKTAFDLNVATPIHHEGQVFISSNYDHGAAMLKITPGAPPQEVYTTKAMQNWFQGCVLYKGHLYGFNKNRLTCLEWSTGALKWDKSGLGLGSLLIADGQLIILSERGELVLADASPAGFEERARWKTPLQPSCWTAPMLSNGVLYLRNQERLVAVEMKAPTP